MPPLNRHLWTEMTAVVLVAIAVGIAWNHRLLHSVWTGRAVATATEQAAPAGAIPLPLGLMQVKELFDRREAVVVDARDGAAFAAGHIEGAISLPIGEAEAQRARFWERVPFSAAIVVYCNGYDCRDSRELGERLIGWGYGTVYVYEGGYPEWRDAGYPTAGGER